MPRVFLTRYIERRIDNSGFTGYIEMLETRIDYTLVLPQGLEWLHTVDLPSITDIRQNFVISAMKGIKPLELTNDEYMALYALLVGFVSQFETSPECENKGIGIALLMKMAEAFGQETSASCMKMGFFDVGHQIYDVFLSRKFQTR